MTVKEWIEELKCCDENSEVIFSIEDDIPCESWTEDKYGNKEVSVNSDLEATFICEISGNCWIELELKEGKE